MWNSQSLEEVQVANIARHEVESNARLNLGDNLLLLGRSDEAEVHFQRIEQIVRAQPKRAWMLWRYSQRLFHSYGELWLLRGDPDKALSYADECLVLAEESNSRKNIVKGRRLRGQALLAQDKLTEAGQELAIALDVAQQIGNPPQLWKTYAALGDLGQAQGKPDKAHRFYSKALTVIETVAANLSNQSLRDTLLNSAQVQEIRTKRGIVRN